MTAQPSADGSPEDLEPFVALPSARLALQHEPADPGSIAAGLPSTASRTLLHLSSAEIGVWEMTEGGLFDTEVDEVFVVLSGRAMITRLDEPELPSIEIGPGTICRLTATERPHNVEIERIRS